MERVTARDVVAQGDAVGVAVERPRDGLEPLQWRRRHQLGARVARGCRGSGLDKRPVRGQARTSCPAVSQTCSFTVRPSMWNVRFLTSTPKLGVSAIGEPNPSLSLFRRLVLPTALSPSKTTFSVNGGLALICLSAAAVEGCADKLVCWRRCERSAALSSVAAQREQNHLVSDTQEAAPSTVKRCYDALRSRTDNDARNRTTTRRLRAKWATPHALPLKSTNATAQRRL